MITNDTADVLYALNPFTGMLNKSIGKYVGGHSVNHNKLTNDWERHCAKAKKKRRKKNKNR